MFLFVTLIRSKDATPESQSRQPSLLVNRQSEQIPVRDLLVTIESPFELSKRFCDPKIVSPNLCARC